MEAHARLNRSHYDEMAKVLKSKAEDIKTYTQTNNHSIQHLDVSKVPEPRQQHLWLRRFEVETSVCLVLIRPHDPRPCLKMAADLREP